ncbi:hypothetical protein IWZ00DRAFT_517114 [Phyllosticta capitalensis]
MKSHMLGLSAALALSGPSAAFLLPSTADGIAGTVPDREFSLVDPTSQLLTLDCADCPFARSLDEDLVWVHGIENSLLLNFSVVDDHAVELNGVQLYPPTFDTLPQPIPVYQVQADVPLTDIRANINKYTNKALRISSYALEIDPSVTASSGNELVPMTLQLSSLEAQHIDVPALSIKLMKYPEGQVSILPITTAAPIGESTPQANDKECKNWPVLCKWRSIIADRIQSMKGQMGKFKPGCMKGRPHGMMVPKPGRPQTPPPEMESDDERPPHRSGSNEPFHGPHGIMRHHRHGPLARFIHLVSRIMVPIVIGIAFGALTYATGWLVGSLMAFVWLKFNRRSGYESVALDEEEAATKDGVPEEAPPVYQEKEVVAEEQEQEQRQ